MGWQVLSLSSNNKLTDKIPTLYDINLIILSYNAVAVMYTSRSLVLTERKRLFVGKPLRSSWKAHLWPAGKLLEIIAKHHYMSTKLHDMSSAEYLNKLSTVRHLQSIILRSLHHTPCRFWLKFGLTEFLCPCYIAFTLYTWYFGYLFFNYLKIQFMSGKHKCKLNEILWAKQPKAWCLNAKMKQSSQF